MFLSSFFSSKSIISSLIFLIAVGIGWILYFTLDTNFEAQPRTIPRSKTSPLLFSDSLGEELNQIINTARQAWSIVDKK